jgi:hypothetical protein
MKYAGSLHTAGFAFQITRSPDHRITGFSNSSAYSVPLRFKGVGFDFGPAAQCSKPQQFVILIADLWRI